MRRAALAVWLILALGFNTVAAFAQAEHNPAHNMHSGEPADAARVIVKFKKDSALLRKHALSTTASASEMIDTVTARANSLGARMGMRLHPGRALNEHAQVISASGISGAALAERLAAEADVEYAVVDQRRRHFAVPNDPLYTQGPPVIGGTGGPVVGQWYLRAPEGEITSSINASAAWDISTGSPNIVVAVLDTGVRPEHPDLVNRLLAGYDMVSDLQTANDGNVRDADASDPGDWITAGESNYWLSPFYQCGTGDSSWHGTMTASLIGAATNDGTGMAGVAWGVRLLPVRVLGKCGGYDSDIIAGMRWAAGLPVPGVTDNPTPARVINMSLGSSGGACPQSYIDAVNAIVGLPSSVVIVSSAGNNSGPVSVPANCPGVIGVAGLRHVGTKVAYSGLGPEVSISGPAGNCVNVDPALPCLYPILAATNTGLTTPLASTYTDSFSASVGTSFSTPLVAGTVALMLSAQPSLTLAEIKAALQSSARAFPFRGVADDPQTGVIQDCHAPGGTDQCYCTTSTCGAGMLDTASALAAARGLKPHISVTPGTLHPGETVTLSSAGTSVGSGRNVVSVQWSIVDGGGVASNFNGGANNILAMLTPGATGRFTVRLTVTDDQGLTASAEAVLSSVPGVSLFQGWNLLGNSNDATITVSAMFNDPARIATIWKWIPGPSQRWAFYTPSQNDGGAAYAVTKGYDALTTIKAGEGFWVNAKAAFTAQLPTGTPISTGYFQDRADSTQNKLAKGWNLISVGENVTPGAFNQALNVPQPAMGTIPANVATLWAWDNLLLSWYFYSPSLEDMGGTTLTDYITSKNYLDFTRHNKVLGQGVGFWVNH